MTLEFSEVEAPATGEAIEEAEQTLGFKFPPKLRWLFQHANGGRPDPCVYRTQHGATAVSETLPLSKRPASAMAMWRRLQKDDWGLRPALFPFAIDPGGNFFLVDCFSPSLDVYFLHFDRGLERPLEKLDVGFDAFWDRLEKA